MMETGKKHFTKTSVEGKKTYYRCSDVKFKGTQCGAGLFVLCPADKISWILFKNENAHEHESLKKSKPKLTESVKQIIREVIKKKKPKAIFRKLNALNMPLPTKIQMQNMIAKLKIDKFGKIQISIESCKNFWTYIRRFLKMTRPLSLPDTLLKLFPR
jgi:hypothetical protein